MPEGGLIDIDDQRRFCQTADKAVSDLPEGWVVVLYLARDGSAVELQDPDGNLRLFPSSFESLTDEINDAIDFAIEAAVQENKYHA